MKFNLDWIIKAEPSHCNVKQGYINALFMCLGSESRSNHIKSNVAEFSSVVLLWIAGLCVDVFELSALVCH